jgi:hypothetical protein
VVTPGRIRVVNGGLFREERVDESSTNTESTSTRNGLDGGDTVGRDGAGLGTVKKKQQREVEKA